MKSVIFDWDGTLAKTLDLWLAGYQASFESRGYRYDPKFIVKEFFHSHQQVAERYPDLDFQTIAKETREYVFEGLASVELYDGVTETLNSLKQNQKTLGGVIN